MIYISKCLTSSNELMCLASCNAPFSNVTRARGCWQGSPKWQKSHQLTPTTQLSVVLLLFHVGRRQKKTRMMMKTRFGAILFNFLCAATWTPPSSRVGCEKFQSFSCSPKWQQQQRRKPRLTAESSCGRRGRERILGWKSALLWASRDSFGEQIVLGSCFGFAKWTLKIDWGF